MNERKNFVSNLAMFTSKDKHRPVMHHVAFINGKSYATNGTIIVEHDLKQSGFTDEEIEVLNGKMIHRDMFKLVLNFEKVEIYDNEFVCTNNDGETPVGIPFSNCSETFPDISNIFPTKEEMSRAGQVVLNSKLMKEAVSYFGGANVRVTNYNSKVVFENISAEDEGFVDRVLLMSANTVE